jgi:nicotinamidase-related amidase
VVDFDLIPSRTALLNVDVQNCFVAAALDGPVLVERINRFAETCRRAGIVVIHTRHVLRPDGSDMGLLGEFVPPIKEGMLNEDAQSSSLHRDLVVEPRDTILTKPRFGAFFGTDLDELLRAHQIEAVIVSGISTDVCCDTTAREAHARDMKVFFLSDGTATAGPNPVEVQRNTLRLVGALFGHVLTIEQMTERVLRSSDRRMAP